MKNYYAEIEEQLKEEAILNALVHRLISSAVDFGNLCYSCAGISL